MYKGVELAAGDVALIAAFSIALVFIVLLVISYVIDIMHAVFSKQPVKKEEPKAAAPKPVAAAPAAASAAPAPAVNDNTAVLVAAAIAAYLSTDVSNIVVTRIMPVPDYDSGWARNALVQSMVE